MRPVEVEVLRRELADKLRVRGAGPELGASLSARLGRLRTLLHIENVDSPIAQRGVARFLRELPHCTAIVTGRVHNLGWDEGWDRIPIQPFEEALALNQLWAELENEPVAPNEEQEHRDLVVALGYLPLAIRLAAGYLLNGGSAPELLRKLRERGPQIEPFHRAVETSDEARTIVSESFQISLEILGQQLGDSASRLLPAFHALGHATLPDFGRSLATAISGLSAEDFEELTVQSVKLTLLFPVSRKERRDGGFRIHPLLAEFLRQSSDSAEPLQRMTEWFVTRLRGRLSRSHKSEQIERWNEIDTEQIALTKWLPLVSGKEKIRVGIAGLNYARNRGPFRLWVEFFEAALREHPTDAEISHLLWGLCRCAIRAGQLDRALEAAQKKAELDERRCEERSAALARGAIADIFKIRGKLEEALKIRQEEQLPVYEKIGDVRERAVTLGKIADILQERGQLEEALHIRQKEELLVYERIDDIRERAVTLGKIADILQYRGQLDEALRIRQEEQLPVYEKIGDYRSRAITLGKIADIQRDRGQFDEALRIWQAEELPVYFEKIGDIRERLITWIYMARTYLKRAKDGDRERAAELLCKALPDAKRLQIPEADQIRSILVQNGLACP
jgi:tetratricopeptide (TPR) repeat protein